MKDPDFTGHAKRLLRLFKNQGNQTNFAREIEFTESWLAMLESGKIDKPGFERVITLYDKIESGKYTGSGELSYYFERWRKKIEPRLPEGRETTH